MDMLGIFRDQHQREFHVSIDRGNVLSAIQRIQQHVTERFANSQLRIRCHQRPLRQVGLSQPLKSNHIT
jgi:hypothetical protein